MRTHSEAGPGEIDQSLTDLSALEARLDLSLRSAGEKLADLRRQGRARTGRRAGGADQMKYRLGSALVALGFEDDHYLELLGLFWHSDVALKWLARARKECGSAPLISLVRWILADEDRREWCAAWGAWVFWDRKRELYEAAVQSFLDSGKADDPGATWRSKFPTDDQLELIATLCELDRVAPPEDPNRGEAFEWIRERSGNPRYRAGPVLPEDWL